MPYQRRADPLSESDRIDEQGFHVPPIDQHEAQRAFRRIDGQYERCLGEETADLLADRDAILDGQEVVRRIDRIPPDLQDRGRHRWDGKTGCAGRLRHPD